MQQPENWFKNQTNNKVLSVCTGCVLEHTNCKLECLAHANFSSKLFKELLAKLIMIQKTKKPVVISKELNLIGKFIIENISFVLYINSSIDNLILYNSHFNAYKQIDIDEIFRYFTEEDILDFLGD